MHKRYFETDGNKTIHTIHDVTRTTLWHLVSIRDGCFAIRVTVHLCVTKYKELMTISKKLGMPIYFDLKAYDDPIVIKNTIKALCRKDDMISITYANDNYASVFAAYSSASDVGCKVILISCLSTASHNTETLRVIKDMCSVAKQFGGEGSIVIVTTDYIDEAKSFGLKTMVYCVEKGLLLSESAVYSKYKKVMACGCDYCVV